MILKELLPRAMAASLAALAVSSPADLRADSDEAYNVNDVLLFLQNPAGTVGTDKVAYYSLGSAVTVFRDAAAGSVTNLGNIQSTLNSAFGNDWSIKASTIFVGAAGQNGETSNLSTAVTNGDYARTVYITKARTGPGSVGQANSASPLFDPAQAAVAGNIAGSNNIFGMTQPGVAAFGDTLIDQYNPLFNGNPSTAYGAISGGIQTSIANMTATFGGVQNVVAGLDFYRVAKTTGTNAASSSIWHIANNKTATFFRSDYPGSNGARADYLGTITLSSDGSVNFVAQGYPLLVDNAYTVNDILLFLQNPDGSVGKDKVAYFSLGSAANVFRDAAPGSVTNLGNINATLNATFGSDWANKSATIFVGAAGQNGETSSLSTAISNGDYARTVYITKARTGPGSVGQANSASPLFDPAQAAVAGNIAGSNNISGMTQPGVAAFGDTLIDQYNPLFNGNPSTAYGAISGGIQTSIANMTAMFGGVQNVVAGLDLYRVTKTTGTNAASSSIWHVANNKTATFSRSDYPGSNGARADYLGTITLSSDGSVIFSAQAEPGSTPPSPVITSANSASAQVGSAFTYQITASNNPNSFAANVLPAGLSVNTTSGLISGTPTTAGNYSVTISAANLGGSANATLNILVSPASAIAPVITGNNSAIGQVGFAFSYQITASNNATSFGATLLSTGATANLTVNSSTGLISGTPVNAGIASVPIFATNSAGQGNGSLILTILPPAPVVSSNTSASGQVGSAFSYQITASNNATSFGATGLPAGLSLNSTSGLISGMPSASGNSSVTITATNAGGTGNTTLNLSISPAPVVAPAITSNTSASGQVGSAFSYQITASNNATSFGATGLPGNLTINTSTGLISGTPASAGNFTANISATNAGGTGNATLRIQVTLPARPSITSVASANGSVGTAFNFQVTASNNATAFNASGLPAGLTINATSGLITGTPTAAGNFTANVSAANAGGNGSASLAIRILPARPAITSAVSTNGTVGTAFSFQVTASNNATTFNASGLPAGLTINATNGRITGTPTAAGNFTANISATNAGGAGSASLEIRIVPVRPAITSAASANGSVGTAFNFQITASNNATAFNASGLPAGLSINATNGRITGTPTAAGNFTANISATNAGGTGSANLTIRVLPAPPSITSAASANGTAGTAFNFQVTGSNNATSFSARGLPAGLSINATNGRITGTPSAAGNFTANISATNAGGTGSANLTIRILPQPPAIRSAASANGTVGTAFNFQVTASNNATAFNASGLPAGLSINATNGRITGTPTAAGNFTANISATNAGGTGSANLTIRVLPARPAITSATSANGSVGTALNFQVTASNNATSFSARGLPAGLTINATTGLITGTPTAAGNFTANISATNAGGTGSGNLRIRVLPARPAITSATSASGKVGTAFTFQVVASNAPRSFGASGLPAGLTINATSGRITGTPTTAGSFTANISATNAGGTGTGTINFTIAPRN